ncbi:MAG: glycosyltransferase [Roseburia sp.]|nr:glycosyltransferase [Roseburia sp.]
MKKLPLLSIIVPVYNILNYLPRCVHSITAQTYERLEIILVDDGSTDGTGKLCDSLAAQDYRIRVYHRKNGGSSAARNTGLSLAKGEYIGFVDSDDYIEPDMYEKLYAGIVETGARIAQIGRNEIDEEGRLLPDICVPPEKQEFLSSHDFMEELLMHRGDCSFCTKLIHRELFAEHSFPEGLLNEDFRLLVQLLTLTEGVLSLPGYGYHVFYRIGSNSRRADREDFSRVYGDCVDNADMAEELVKESYPDLRQTALRFGVFQRLEYLLHIPISQMKPENTQYRQIVGYMRRNWWRGVCNHKLTAKNKCYQTLFAIAPRGIRVLHRKLKRL